MRQLHVMDTGAPENFLNVLGESIAICGGGDATKPFEIHLQKGDTGGGPPPHYHPWDEAFCVLEGKVKVTVDGEERIVSQGMVIHIPANTVHAYENLSDGATLLGVVSDPKGGEMFRQIDREVKVLPEDLPKVISIGQQYGVEFV
ncbi:MAG: cupin domain-containing protein [Pseudomonadota bacterium]